MSSDTYDDPSPQMPGMMVAPTFKHEVAIGVVQQLAEKHKKMTLEAEREIFRLEGAMRFAIQMLERVDTHSNGLVKRVDGGDLTEDEMRAGRKVLGEVQGIIRNLTLKYEALKSAQHGKVQALQEVTSLSVRIIENETAQARLLMERIVEAGEEAASLPNGRRMPNVRARANLVRGVARDEDSGEVVEPEADAQALAPEPEPESEVTAEPELEVQEPEPVEVAPEPPVQAEAAPEPEVEKPIAQRSIRRNRKSMSQYRKSELAKILDDAGVAYTSKAKMRDLFKLARDHDLV